MTVVTELPERVQQFLGIDTAEEQAAADGSGVLYASGRVRIYSTNACSPTLHLVPLGFTASMMASWLNSSDFFERTMLKAI